MRPLADAGQLCVISNATIRRGMNAQSDAYLFSPGICWSGLKVTRSGCDAPGRLGRGGRNTALVNVPSGLIQIIALRDSPQPMSVRIGSGQCSKTDARK